MRKINKNKRGREEVAELKPPASLISTKKPPKHKSSEVAIIDQTTKPDTTKHNMTQPNTKPDTTRHNLTPHLTQLDTNDASVPDTTRHKRDTRPDTTKHNLTQEKATLTRHNLTQIDAEKFFLNSTGNKLKSLVGLCRIANELGSKEVQSSYEALAESLGIKSQSIKTTLKRLRDIGVIQIYGAQGGKGAVKNFIVNSDYLNAYNIINQRDTTKHNMTQGFVPVTRHKPDTTLDTNPLSSSSSIFKEEEKTTTTKLPKLLAEDLSIQWDLEVLKVHEGQLNQIASLLNSGRVSESLLRLSLSEVAFHKQNGGKFNKDAVSALFSALRTGHGFTSPIREEIELERKNQIEKELIKKAHAEQKRIDQEYQPWRSSLSEEKRLELIKELNGLDRTKEIQEVLLKTYFSKRVN